MIKNLTPHSITFICDSGEKIVVEPSGTVARLATRTLTTGSFDGIPITETVFGEVEGLPKPEAGTIYLVSSLVAKACPDRDDVFIPHESVCDDQGRIIGCKSLGRV